MDGNIKLLEERVLQAVDRLRELSTERNRLKEELERLHKRLEVLERGRSGAGASSSAGAGSVKAAELAATLREAIRELRGA